MVAETTLEENMAKSFRKLAILCIHFAIRRHTMKLTVAYGYPYSYYTQTDCVVSLFCNGIPRQWLHCVVCYIGVFSLHLTNAPFIWRNLFPGRRVTRTPELPWGKWEGGGASQLYLHFRAKRTVHMTNKPLACLEGWPAQQSPSQSDQLFCV